MMRITRVLDVFVVMQLIIFIILTFTYMANAESNKAQCVYFETAEFIGEDFRIRTCDGNTIRFSRKQKGEFSL